METSNEKIILYSMITERVFYKELDINDFTDFYNRETFKAIESLYKQGKPIDENTVNLYFSKDKNLQNYLVTLYADTVPTQPYHYYLSEIKKESDRRKSFGILKDAESKLQTKEPKEVLQELEKNISFISEKQKLRDIREIDKPYKIEDLRNDWLIKSEGYETGYKDLDQYVSFKPGTVNFIAGRPGSGKTTFMLNLLCNMVEKHKDNKFYFISYEETQKKLSMKAITILAKDTYSNTIRTITENQFNNYDKDFPYNRYTDYNNSNRLRILYETFEIDSLCYFIESLHAKHKDLGVVFIDYIQEIRTNEKYQSRQIELHNICQKLLEIANKTNTALILGSQLNRESKDKPKAESMREADDILNIANTILATWEEPETKDFKILILKNREGEKDKEIKLVWEKPKILMREFNENEKKFSN